MPTWQNKKKKKCLKRVRKVFMPTPLNDERAVNATYLRLNVYQSFSVSMSQYVYNKSS